MGGIAWNTENMYFNTFITNEIYADVSQMDIRGSMEATTAVACMVALSAIAAVLTTVVMGALSDKLKNRKMFISLSKKGFDGKQEEHMSEVASNE